MGRYYTTICSKLQVKVYYIVKIIYHQYFFLHLKREGPSRTRGLGRGLTNLLFPFYDPVQYKQLIESGFNDDLLPALTLSCHNLFVSASLPNQK